MSKSKQLASAGARRRTLIIAAVALMLLVFATAVFAAFYTIDTDDGTVAEWSAQGVPLFQSDPSGDVAPDYAGEDQSDILNVWVATTDNRRLAFLMETAASPALDVIDPETGEPLARMAVAALDCDLDGRTDGPHDLLLAYAPLGDTVWMISGDLNQGLSLGSGDDDDPTLGQVVDNFVEWGVPLSHLAFSKPLINWTVDCTNAINIGFATVDASEWPGPSGIIDETDGLRGWNVPTAVRLQSFNVAGMRVAGEAIALLAGLAVVATAVVVLGRRSKQSF